ncbi:D-aminoacyl-tRNA deacylase DTD [Trinorchestia longiramus]|nr:D-aminoacyl-tRNA deacylase DTD [Trinorchestia longiramus]
MRLVVQRVSSASVTVNEEVVSKIGRGLCVLVGLQDTDTHDDLLWMVNKLLKFRLFDDASGKRWAKGVQDLGLEILCVSQFTLCYEMKGNKPDYRRAMAGEEAAAFYKTFLKTLRQKYEPDKVKDGVFGAMMQVGIVNDGPVTVTLDHPPLHNTKKNSNSSPSSEV